MATLGDLIVKVGAEITGFRDGMATVSQTLGKFSDDSEKMFRGLDALGGQLTSLGATLSAAITLPLVAAGGAAVKFAGDFDSEMRKVSSLIENVTEKDFQSLSGQVLDLSKSMGVDAVKSADALYQALSSGVPKENAVDFLKIATTAAIAGVTDTRVAVDGLTTVLQAFNLQTSETKKVADAMFQAVNIGKLEFPELAASIGIAAGTAHALGISYNELLAAGATLTNTTGQKIPEAMTMLQSAMKALIAPTSDMEKLLAKMGTTGEELVRKNGLEGALKAIEQAAGGNVTVLASLFGRVEGLRATLGLTGDNAQRAASDLDRFAHASDGIGASAAAAAEVNKGFERQLASLTAEIKGVAIELGTALLPIVKTAFNDLKPFIELVGDGVKKFTELPAPIQSTVLGFTAFAAGVGPAVLITGQMISAFGKLAAAIELVNAALASKGIVTALAGLGSAAGIVAGVAAAAGAAGAGIAYLGGKAGDAALAQKNANATWLQGIDAATALSHATTINGGAFDAAKDSVLSFVKTLDSHAKSSGDAVKSAGDLAAAHQALEKSLKAAEDNLSAVEKAEKMGIGTEKDLADARMKVVAAMKALHPEYKDIFAETSQWNNAMQDSKDLIAFQTTEMMKAAPALSQHTALLEAQAISLQARSRLWSRDIADIKDWADALTASNYKLNDNYVDMKALDAIIRDSQGDFKAQENAIRQNTQAFGTLHDAHVLGIQDNSTIMARVDETHDAFVRAATAVDDQGRSLYNLHQIMVAQLQDYSAQIQAGQQLGENTDELQLKYIHLADAIRTQNIGFTDTVTQMHNIANTGFQRVLDDLIFKADDVGKAFKQMGENLVTTFANRILNDALKPVLNALDGIIDKAIRAAEKVLGIGIPSSNGPLSGDYGIPGLPNGGIGSIGDIPGLPGPGGTVPAGGTSGGVSSAISSSLTSMVSAVANVASAVTGIIGVFQSARQETTLNAIEHNTRYAELTLDGPDGIMEWVKKTGLQIVTDMNPMRQDLHGILATAMDMRADTYDIRSKIGNVPPPVTINIDGNVIGNVDFINQIAAAVAAQVRVQGVPA